MKTAFSSALPLCAAGAAALTALALPLACAPRPARLAQTGTASSVTLTQARLGFKTVVQPQSGPRDPVEKAPPSQFLTGAYVSPVGRLAAYLTPDPGDSKKHPAIVWITGGDCNSIGDVWTPAAPDNDQTAAAYRKVGIVMLFPSLRGGNTNPGVKEGFLGEVDDVLAAARFLATLPYVDPARIYLGGHSTGGTLALLTAESEGPFRAVFAFGPVASVEDYGSDSGFLPFDLSHKQEVKLRSPGYWLNSVKSPVWIIEGEERGNISSLREMEKVSRNPRVHFAAVPGQSHFSVLAPANAVIAQKILADTGPTSTLTLTGAEIAP